MRYISVLSVTALAAMTPLSMIPAGPAQAQVVTQPFTFNLVTHDLPHVRHGDAAWGDFDADGDLDVFLTGISAEGGTSRLFINNSAQGQGMAFEEHAQAFPALYFSTVSWADVDGDGDLDLLLMGSQTGERPLEAATHLYINNGGTFAEAADHGIPDLYSAAVDWGDINNDGHVDAVLIGFAAENTPRTTVLYGNGTGVFTDQPTSLPDVTLGDVRLGDLNGDGRLDVVLAGVAGQSGFVADVHLATDDGDFVPQAAPLPRVGFSSLELGDVDSDGDLDVLISGGELSRDLLTGRTQLFENTNGTLSPSGIDFPGTLGGDATLGDYDGDGDLDILIVGAKTALGRRTATIYANRAGDYEEVIRLNGSLFSSAEWADVDGDGDLDLLTTGFTSAGLAATNVYINEQQVIPLLADAPTSAAAEVTENDVHLSWSFPRQDVTYNLRVGTAPGRADVMTAESDLESGRRLVPRPGNTRTLSSWRLHGLDEGTYYWSVQAVSHAFQASRFSSEGTFSVTSVRATDTDPDEALPTKFAVRSLYPNPLVRTGHMIMDLPAADALHLTLYDALGARIVRTHLGPFGAGTQYIAIDPASLAGRALSPGLYFFEIEGQRERRTGSFTYLPTR